LQQRLQDYIKKEACLKNELDEIKADKEKKNKE